MHLQRVYQHSSKGGVCITHGAPVKRCSFEGCTNFVIQGGFCRRHGAVTKRCNFKGGVPMEPSREEYVVDMVQLW